MNMDRLTNNPVGSGDPSAAGGCDTVLVTGAAGHLGANLVRALIDRGQRVRVLLQEQCNNTGVDGLAVERIYGDLRDRDSTRSAVAGCSRIYHCAAMISTINGNSRHRRDIFECNVVGTRNLLQAAREHGVQRVVVTGSFSAIGYRVDDPSAPVDESNLFYPFHQAMPYERSKLQVEHECLKAFAEGQDVVVAVCCAIIGGNDFLPSRLGRVLCEYANGRLPAYVRGGFEFVAAEDIVEGHLLCMEKGRGGQRYIFSSEFLTLDQLLDLYQEVSGVSTARRRLPGPVMALFSELVSWYLSRFHADVPQRLTPGAIRLLRQCRHADISKATQELGYQPTPIRHAVAEAYAFHYGRGTITNPRARAPQAYAGRPTRQESPSLSPVLESRQ
jgi:nucleoside-diphosphate-sugar epimerase